MSKESSRCQTKQHRAESVKKGYGMRLNRIEGQVRGIHRMVDDDRCCDDILIQISAVTNSLKSLGQEILNHHMKTCMVEDIKKDHLETIDEVMDFFRKLV